MRVLDQQRSAHVRYARVVVIEPVEGQRNESDVHLLAYHAHPTIGDDRYCG
jgi:hypothetical protein